MRPMHLDGRTDPEGPPDRLLPARFTAALDAADELYWIAELVNGLAHHTAGNESRRPPPTVEDPLGQTEAPVLVTAREFAALCHEIEERLAHARTGPLLRVVVDNDRAAAFCFTVVPEEQVVAFSGHPAGDVGAVDTGDRAMTALVDVLRDDLGLTTQNPGGQPETAHSPPSRAGGAHLRANRGEDTPLWQAAIAAASPGSIQWVCHVRRGSAPVTADVFDHPDLSQHFRAMDRQERRWFYESLAREAAAVAGRFNRVLRPVLAGPLRRVVLDVERGVIVIQRLGPFDHVVGVTLDQRRVAAAESAMRRIAGVADASRQG